MFRQLLPIILASNSPRRKAYLSSLGLKFTVVPATIDETPFSGELPEQFACRMAEAKAQVISQTYPNHGVLAADTVVTIDHTILGKPTSSDQALHFLQTLRGRQHEVITGVALIHARKKVVFSDVTQVWFENYPDEVLRNYVQSGDPMDKAGAYGIQSFGGFLIKSINGSYSNVVGLPVAKVMKHLLEESIISCSSELAP